MYSIIIHSSDCLVVQLRLITINCLAIYLTWEHQRLTTGLIWSPGHEQNSSTGYVSGDECDCLHSCKTRLITHTVTTQRKSCQNGMADFYLCRCQCIPGAHYSNCDKWKSNSQRECMTHCYIITRTMFCCWANCCRNLRHFWKQEHWVYSFFLSPRQDSVARRLSRGMTHTSLPGATPCPSAWVDDANNTRRGSSEEAAIWDATQSVLVRRTAAEVQLGSQQFTRHTHLRTDGTLALGYQRTWQKVWGTETEEHAAWCDKIFNARCFCTKQYHVVTNQLNFYMKTAENEMSSIDNMTFSRTQV